MDLVRVRIDVGGVTAWYSNPRLFDKDLIEIGQVTQDLTDDESTLLRTVDDMVSDFFVGGVHYALHRRSVDITGNNVAIKMQWRVVR